MEQENFSMPFEYNPNPKKGFFENLGAHLIDFFQTLVVFGAFFALLYLFIAQPHKVSGSSMYPTFHDGDYILTDKLTYRFQEPKPGDIVVFRNPRNESQDFIKRVIAVPGDTVIVSEGKVYVNGQKLQEVYLPSGTTTRPDNFLTEGAAVKVGKGQYFVLGDNRSHSSDSREWGGVSKNEIVGKAFFRYWPPNAFGLVKSLPST